MILLKASRSVTILCLPLSSGLWFLFGCSKVAAPAPVMAVSLTTVTTNGTGETQVQLNLTNTSARAVLVGVRSVIYQADGARVTNFGIHAPFVGVTGPSSEASDLAIAAGSGMTAALKPFRVPHPFQIEFVCFPSRSGVGGIVDKARDKVEEFKDGSRRESYGGESFFVLSPVIDSGTGPDGPANGSPPIRSEMNSTPSAPGSRR